MALVRCPIHKIPFNDENPRGCPACAREKEGKGRPSLMQELAKAHKTEKPAPPSPAEKPQPTTPRPTQPPHHPAYRHPAVSVSQPVPGVTEVKQPSIVTRIGKRAFRRYLVGLVAIMVVAWIWSSRPQFTESLHPASPSSSPRPLPLSPNVTITSAFSILGNRTPKANPDSDRLSRYTYGTDLTIDALNGVVYAITVKLPNRSWEGLQTGVPEQTAMGALALLGRPSEPTVTGTLEPSQDGKYYYFPSLNERPARTVQVEVRPPNGCYDAQLEIRPQAIGTLRSGESRFAVVGIDNATLNWVVTQVRIVSRSMRGPYAGTPEC